MFFFTFIYFYVCILLKTDLFDMISWIVDATKFCMITHGWRTIVRCRHMWFPPKI